MSLYFVFFVVVALLAVFNFRCWRVVVVDVGCCRLLFVVVCCSLLRYVH